jgi:excisionase family DNA binding protein
MLRSDIRPIANESQYGVKVHTFFLRAAGLICDDPTKPGIIESWTHHECAPVTLEVQLIPNQPLAVSFREAAQITSVSRSTLRRYAKIGRLRTVRLGRRVIVPFEALKDLIQEGSGEGSAREVR